MAKIPFLFFRLLSQNVTVIRMLSFNFTCSGKSKSFFRTGVSLNFWHLVKLFFLIINIVVTHYTNRRYSLFSISFSAGFTAGVADGTTFFGCVAFLGDRLIVILL